MAGEGQHTDDTKAAVGREKWTTRRETRGGGLLFLSKQYGHLCLFGLAVLHRTLSFNISLTPRPRSYTHVHCAVLGAKIGGLGGEVARNVLTKFEFLPSLLLPLSTWHMVFTCVRNVLIISFVVTRCTCFLPLPYFEVRTTRASIKSQV